MTTDYIVLAMLLYLFCKGWTKGFLKTLLGPFSLVLGCIAGLIYYQKTQNIPIALVICVIGPFFINLLILVGLKLLQKAEDGKPPKLPISSRLLGSIVSLLWGGSYLVIMLFLIAIVPLKIAAFDRVQQDVLASRSYGLISSWTKNKVPAAHYDIGKIQKLLEDPASMEQFEDSAEYKALADDEILRSILEDEETAEQIRTKNYQELLTNPKMQELLSNEELLKKIFALNKRIMESGPDEEKQTSQPKVINVE